MIYRFNKAQLSREQRESLEIVLDVFQVENKNEIEVAVVEFPNKFKVKLDDIEVIVVWDDEKKSYGGLSEPIPTAEQIIEQAKKSKLESEKDTVDIPAQKPGLEPEPIIQPHIVIDPIQLAALKYELMKAHLEMPNEKKIVFAKEYARLWSEHR